VLFWSSTLETHQVRRFQTAAEIGDCVTFIFTGSQQNQLFLPVSLSLSLAPHASGLQITVPKRRGGWPLPAFIADMSAAWPALTLTKIENNVLLFPTAKAV